MKIYFYLLICLLSVTQAYAQATILPQAEVARLFNDSIKRNFSIDYPIFRAYTYTDKSGKYVVALTEKRDSITPEKDTLHHKIKALAFKLVQNRLEKQWEINDFTIRQVNNNGDETSIWFWTKFCEFKDLDGDGLVEPIIVYGTSGLNGYDDGRIKILVFYKGQKLAIRHQSGVLDNERFTDIDQGIYSLKSSIQDHIKQLIKKMVANNSDILLFGW